MTKILGATIAYFFVILIFASSLVSCDDTQRNNVIQVEEQVERQPNELPTKEKKFTERDLQYEGKTIKITHHARCRMDCREIEAVEIQEIINKKQINRRKSKPNPPAGKCPSIAYEGRTKRDNQKIRVILGECEKDPIIITVIDLENHYQCSCR